MAYWQNNGCLAAGLASGHTLIAGVGSLHSAAAQRLFLAYQARVAILAESEDARPGANE